MKIIIIMSKNVMIKMQYENEIVSKLPLRKGKEAPLCGLGHIPMYSWRVHMHITMHIVPKKARASQLLGIPSIFSSAYY